MLVGHSRFVVLSGCSGGGKSTLLQELRRRGFHGIDEPGRRVVRDERERGCTALPWIDLAGFARRTMSLALADLDVARGRSGWVFFDRGLVDAAAALQHATGEALLTHVGRHRHYHQTVYLTPPWPEIHVADPERQLGQDEAVAEYARLERAYPALGYRIVVLPKASVGARADLVLAELGTLK